MIGSSLCPSCAQEMRRFHRATSCLGWHLHRNADRVPASFVASYPGSAGRVEKPYGNFRTRFAIPGFSPEFPTHPLTQTRRDMRASRPAWPHASCALFSQKPFPSFFYQVPKSVFISAARTGPNFISNVAGRYFGKISALSRPLRSTDNQ